MVIAVDLLYNNFDTITASLLKTRDKLINKIQSILQSKKVKNISKCITERTEELAMAFKNNNNPKQKAFNHKKYFNSHKLKHFEKDHLHPNKRQTNLQARNNLKP